MVVNNPFVRPAISWLGGIGGSPIPFDIHDDKVRNSWFSDLHCWLLNKRKEIVEEGMPNPCYMLLSQRVYLKGILNDMLITEQGLIKV